MIPPLSAWPFAEKFVVIAAAAAILCALFIVVLRPVLVRYALARPNARSSHREPTPQGGGIAVIAAMALVLAGVAIVAPQLLSDPLRVAIIFAAAIGVAIVGATDDIRPMEAMPRLALQAVAALVVIVALPSGLQIFPVLPWWFERAAMLIGILWFVNLVNFMDGLDWITVAEVAPVSAALVAIGAIGNLPSDAMIVALALLGAIIGFAPFNRPVAKLFLGDVGSLPIGLLLAWLLILLAANGFIIAAILLPLYYIAVCSTARPSRRRTARTSINAPPTVASAFMKSSAECSSPTLCWLCSPSAQWSPHRVNCIWAHWWQDACWSPYCCGVSNAANVSRAPSSPLRSHATPATRPDTRWRCRAAVRSLLTDTACTATDSAPARHCHAAPRLRWPAMVR